MLNDTQNDYLVVEQSLASPVLKSLLSEGIEHKMLVLESAGSDEGIFVQVSTALSYLMDMTKYAGCFYYVCELNLNNRSIHWHVGKPKRALDIGG